MGERKRDSSRLPAAPPGRYRAHGPNEDRHAEGNGSRAEDGGPATQARMPRDVAAVLDELRAAAETHDGDLKYSFLEAS